MAFIAYVEGPVRSYVRRFAHDHSNGPREPWAPPQEHPAGRGLEFTSDLGQARRFASQADISAFLALYPGNTIDVRGGTGTAALQVS